MIPIHCFCRKQVLTYETGMFSLSTIRFIFTVDTALISAHMPSPSDFSQSYSDSWHWRHNDHSGVSNHQPHGCLLSCLFRRRSKKNSKLRVTGLCAGNSPGPVNSPHKGPVTRKIFPFDDVIMSNCCIATITTIQQPSAEIRTQTVTGRETQQGLWYLRYRIQLDSFTWPYYGNIAGMVDGANTLHWVIHHSQSK